MAELSIVPYSLRAWSGEAWPDNVFHLHPPPPGRIALQSPAHEDGHPQTVPNRPSESSFSSRPKQDSLDCWHHQRPEDSASQKDRKNRHSRDKRTKTHGLFQSQRNASIRASKDGRVETWIYISITTLHKYCRGSCRRGGVYKLSRLRLFSRWPYQGSLI
jgi:hypothetical protein